MHILHKWRKIKVWQAQCQTSVLGMMPRAETITFATGFRCDKCGKKKVVKGAWWSDAPQEFIDETNRWE